MASAFYKDDYILRNRRIGTKAAMELRLLNRTAQTRCIIGARKTNYWDGARNVIGSIDSNNNRSTVVRDRANRPISQVNALNFRSSTSYDANSNPIQTIDALNRISTNVMDPLNRVQATITPLGFITTVNRDADGRTVSVQNANGFLSSTVFNAASQQIASVSPLGLIQTTIRDIAGQVLGNQNSLSQIYTNVLDANGAAIATVSPMGFRSSVVLDAASQRIATIDALGNRASSVWAANGQLIASQSELGFLTSFILDAASQRVCVVDANNGRSSSVFDVRGLVSVEIDQLNARTSFSHDNNGNTTLRVDARNWPTSYTIDHLNRTAQTQYIDNTRVTNSWDAAGQQLTGADSTGITSYVWDLDSRKTATQNPTGINLTSTLEPLGNRLVLQDNYGVTSYAWDNQSRLITIWNPLNERTTIAYDALNREQHRVLGNGGTISHTWDANGRETLIENRDKAGVGQFIATNTYSAVDSRLTVLEMDGTRATYAYDASRQITSEARGGTMAYARSYVWDALGNRSQQFDSGALTQSTFNGANQLLVSTPASGPATTTSYDAVGNTIGINTGGALTTQIWSPDNRLASYADSKGNSEQFLYSQDGLKKQRINGAATTLFTYDEAALMLESDASLNLQARYTNRPITWGGLASQSRSGVSRFYGFDTQMSARILVSLAGVVTDAYSWKAFGEPIQGGSGTINPYGYIANALYYTEFFDLINAWNRWLKASVGRWESRDAIGFASGQWNLFGYVGNSPIGSADPDGYQTAIDPGCGMPWVILVPGPPAFDPSKNWPKRWKPCKTECQKVSIPGGGMDIPNPGRTFTPGSSNCPSGAKEIAWIKQICRMDKGDETATPGNTNVAFTCCCTNDDNSINACTGYSPGFGKLPKIYQDCTLTHEKERRQCCFDTGNGNLSPSHQGNMYLWCAWKHLMECFTEAGAKNMFPECDPGHASGYPVQGPTCDPYAPSHCPEATPR